MCGYADVQMEGQGWRARVEMEMRMEKANSAGGERGADGETRMEKAGGEVLDREIQMERCR